MTRQSVWKKSNLKFITFRLSAILKEEVETIDLKELYTKIIEKMIPLIERILLSD